MKFFTSGGKREFDPRGFYLHMAKNGLLIDKGEILFANILEREPGSNRGNALDGMIKLLDSGIATGLNIGGNPIGTGYHNFISFLDEIGCKTQSGLYVMDDLKGKEIYVIERGSGIHKNTEGFLTPAGFDELYDAIAPQLAH